MNLMLFYAWESASIWAHWNHHFDWRLKQRSLVGYSPWGCKDWGMTEWLAHFTLAIKGQCPPWNPSGCKAGAALVAAGSVAPAAIVCWTPVRAQSLQSCPTVARQAPLSMGFSQAKILEWVAMPSSRGSAQPRDWTNISCMYYTEGGFFTHWATGKTL